MIDINWNPSRKELRVFAILETIFFAIVAWTVFRKTGSQQAALTIVGIAAAVAVVGTIVPRFMHWVYVVWMVAVFPIGFVVSHVVAAAVFYLVVTPIGLIMRALGKDPMERQFQPESKSYWLPRDQEQGTRRYFRQF